jgi:hypothetical protein
MPYLCNAEVMAFLHDYFKKLIRGQTRFCSNNRMANEKSLRWKDAGFFLELA